MILHVAWKMPSLLEIYFSTQQLCCVVEYREPCVVTEFLPHEKYFVFHGWHTLPHYLFGGIWFSFLTVFQQGLLNLWGVERPLIFSWERKFIWSMRNHKKMSMYLALLIYGWKKGPMRSLWIISKGEEALWVFPLSNFSWGCFQEHIPHRILWRNECIVDHQPIFNF